MNIYKELNEIVEYIEDNLEEKIEYKELAKKIGVNEHTLQRLFSILNGLSLSEYIRNRRLSMAGQELYLKNTKIVDVATKYQYGNSTAFSRAFEKFHGIKPSEVRKNPEKLKIHTKIHFYEDNESSRDIEYKIINEPKMILYGKSKNTTNTTIQSDAPRFFKYIEDKYGKPMYGMVEYKEKERINVKSYWVLYNRQYDDLEKVIIPEGKWILMKINSQDAEEIQNMSRIFYRYFFPNCQYNFRDLPEIEYYHNDVTDFLISIEDK